MRVYYRVLILFLLVGLLLTFTRCEGVQNNKNQQEKSKETQELDANIKQNNEKIMLVNRMINQLDKAAAFVVITVRNYVNIGMNKPGGGINLFTNYIKPDDSRKFPKNSLNRW